LMVFLVLDSRRSLLIVWIRYGEAPAHPLSWPSSCDMLAFQLVGCLVTLLQFFSLGVILGGICSVDQRHAWEIVIKLTFSV
jgi:hypothetical protein